MPETDLSREGALEHLAETIVSTMREQAQWLQGLKRARLAVTIKNELGQDVEVVVVRDEKSKDITLTPFGEHSFDTFERQEWKLVIREPTPASS